MRTYIIGSTSNLLKENSVWDVLKKQVNINFQSYGDILTGLISNSETGVIVVIFVEDLIQNVFDDYSLAEKANETFFNLIEKRTIESDEPIIVCIASRGYSSFLESARIDSKFRVFYNELIKKLIKVRDQSTSLYFINLNDVFYESGSEQNFSDRNWYFARCRLSSYGMGNLVSSLLETVRRIYNPPKKVLVLDCDNTLWGGVVGEDGLEGLVLGQDGPGQAYIDFQKECLRLTNRGILLALASKNNEEDVWDVFENHPSMILKRQNILCSRLNWNEKTTSLLEMSNELDLGLDSFVFWDDNPIERQKIYGVLPEVLTIEVPKQVIKWPNFIRSLNCFSSFKITSEDTKKQKQYKARAAFISDLNHTNDVFSILRSINLLPSKIGLCDANITRAEQMCKKTNQFNLRKKSYTIKELQAYNSDPKTNVFLVSLKDYYGDHGLVALAGLKSITKEIVFIDIFLMSCRVLGRHLEAWILNELLKLARQKGADNLLVDFIDNGKNRIAKEFLLNNRFKIIGKNSRLLKLLLNQNKYAPEGKVYQIPIRKLIIQNLDIYDRSNDKLA